MAELKVTYFDFPGGRGEDVRLALHVAGVAFDDDRVKPANWPQLRADTPFGALPVLTVAGLGRISEANAILAYLGRRFDLHPSDPWRAAVHESLMGAVEDARKRLGDTLAMASAEKKATREKLAADYLPDWGRRVESQLATGPYVEAGKLTVTDLKLFVFLRWFKSGALDHVPTDLFDGHARLNQLYRAVESHPSVASWLNRAT